MGRETGALESSTIVPISSRIFELAFAASSELFVVGFSIRILNKNGEPSCVALGSGLALSEMSDVSIRWLYRCSDLRCPTLLCDGRAGAGQAGIITFTDELFM